MHQEKSPSEGASQQMARNEDDYQDKKLQVDIRQMDQDFLPVDTAEEKEEENKGKEENDSQPDGIFSHDESSILSSEISQVNQSKKADSRVNCEEIWLIFKKIWFFSLKKRKKAWEIANPYPDDNSQFSSVIPMTMTTNPPRESILIFLFKSDVENLRNIDYHGFDWEVVQW